MKSLRTGGAILAVVFSVIFAGLLFPEIVGTHGVPKAVFFVGLGVSLIWLFWFGLGCLLGHVYAAGQQDERDNETDFI